MASFRFPAERRLLAGLLLFWSAYSTHNAWDFIGPHGNPGMRGATAYLLEKRSDDEMVVSQTPFEFFKLLYYMRHTSRPVLCVAQPGRHSQRGTVQLLDTDLMTPEEILQSKPKGMWLVTSASYDASHQMNMPLPEQWREIERREFLQDFHLEQPITVRHYRRE